MSRLSTPGPAPFARQGHRGPPPPRGSLLRRRLRSLGHHARAAALALAALAGLTLGGPAGAQADVLVSNIGQIDDGGYFASGEIGSSFTTGGDATLTSIEIRFGNSGAAAVTTIPTVKVFTGSVTGGNLTLGTEVAALTGPASIPTGTGNYTYTPQTSTALAASTTYYVLIQGLGSGLTGSGTDSSDNVDSSSLSGWGIPHSYYFRNSGSTGSLIENLGGGRVMFRVNGTVDVPAADATLSALALTGATLTPTFASTTTTYTATVSGDVSQTTVTATPTNASATVAFFDASDTALTDADSATDGFQADLGVGDTVIKAKVTSEDSTTETYQVTVTRPVPGDAPRNLRTIEDDVRFRLVWSPPSDPGSKTLTGYEYRYAAGTSVTGDPAWTDVPGRWVAVTDLQNSTWYTFEVRAVYGLEASEANTATVRTAVPRPRLTSTYATGVAGDTTIELRWTAIGTLGGEAVTGYRIEESSDGAHTWTELVADTGNLNTTYRRTGFTRGEVRHYRVRARSAGKTSDFSAPVGASTRPPVPPKPVATLTPVAALTPVALGRYILSWAPVETTGRGVREYKFHIPGARGVWSERPTIRTDGHLYIKVDGSEALVKNIQVRAVIHGRRLPGGTYDEIAGPWSDQAGFADDTPDAPAAFNPFSALMIGPRSHDGRRAFSLELHFNKVPEQLSKRTVRDALLEVNAGTVTDAQRVTPGSDQRWRVTVRPAGAGDVHVRLPARSQPCTDEATVCAGVERLVEAVSHVVRGSRAVLSASFAAVPSSHDGKNPFTVKLSFSEEPELSYKTVRDSLLEVSCATESCGTVTDASRVTKGNDSEWKVTVEPSQAYGITLTLPVRACDETGAVCVGGRPLAAPASATIPGAPLAATLTGPAEHDGSESFTVRLTFSMEPDVSYKTVRDTMFTEKGGTITGARRVKPPHDREFDIVVKPGGNAAVSLALASPLPACGETGAVCTAAGRKIEGTASATIPGPAALSVADARVREGPGAKLAFAVTLDRARGGPVTVDYVTVPGTGAGAATEGSDYTRTSGQLTFAASETSKTVEVEVLADAHDEDSETMTLTLTSPAGARIADGTATGTIENTGAIPRAWVARFGRTVADQVLDAVDARLRASRASGVSVSPGGQRIGGAAPRAAVAASVNGAGTSAGKAEPDTKPASPFGAAAQDTEGTAQMKALSEWMSQETADDDRSRGRSRTLTGRQVLMGSSFSLAARTDGDGFAALWGRMAQTRFAGREDSLNLDGEVTTGLLGADHASGRWTTGLVISHSIGEGGYQASSRSERNRGESSGEVEATVTALTPWAGYAVTERLSVWGAAGYGAGDLTLTPAGAPALKTDLGMMLAAGGARGTLVGGEGPKLDAVTDARWVRTRTARVSSAAGNLASASAQVTRLRLGLEGSWPLALGDAVLGAGATAMPRLALGVRHDGGDAETGFGADIGGGLTLAAPAQGLTVSLDGRGVLTHEAAGFRDRGVAGTLAWNPPPSDRGPTLSLSQSIGAGASGGKDALLSRETLEGLAANDDGDGRRRLEARFGYGLAAFGGGFTMTPEIGLGLSEAGRDYRLGWRLTRSGSGPGPLELSVEATRRESANDDTPPEHGVGARFALRW